MPAIFEQGDFCLVPTQSVHAIIEVKRTTSSLDKLAEQLDQRRKLLRMKCRQNLLGIVVEHSSSLFADEVKANWLTNRKWRTECPIISLLTKNEPNVDDIMTFIYFVAQIAGHQDLAV